MKLVTENYSQEINDFAIGAKAVNLFRSKALGFSVPKFVVIPIESFLKMMPENFEAITACRKKEVIASVSIPAGYLKQIISCFPEGSLFAVRSSAEDEDGSSFSFAGQFESYLNVAKENLEESIKKVWNSAFSERVMLYRKNHHLKENSGIAVIVQEMVAATVSGVAFSINPATGERDVKTINAVYGLGEGLVSGELNADTFFINESKIKRIITTKTHQVVSDPSGHRGTKTILVETSRQQLPALDDQKISEVANVLDVAEKEWRKPIDIEFAYRGRNFYLLQVRPITNLHKITDPNAACILWDNSNIIESYPGVTTPLTFSFISKSYEGAYRLFCSFMGVSDAVLTQNAEVFANTLGFINGRVYYNLKSWYHMLAMLPGYSINARFMEKMMGVTERFDIPDSYRLSKGKAWWSILKMAARMYYRFLSLPRKRRQFVQRLNTIIADFKNIDFAKKNPGELMLLYRGFETQLLNDWKAPLLNDFFAMIWFGLLEKKCKKYVSGTNANIHNDLLCGSKDVISTQPIHRCMALAGIICGDDNLKTLFNNNPGNIVWQKLNTGGEFAAIKKEIDKYIYDFGERCIGELKLETVSYTQDPAKFIKQLQGYVAADITTANTSAKVEEELRRNAEQQINASLKYKLLKKFIIKKTIKRTRELVSARENLRYERTRAFGIVRELFSHIGKRFYAEGIIQNERDIFYLGKDEIFSFIEGTSLTQNIKSLIALRKEESDEYKTQTPPPARFATYGPVYHANDFFASVKTEPLTGDIKGTGCSPGKVRGKVKVVSDPTETNFMNGAILVTSSTDPGWTILFPSCSGIIVERGSLLSHSSIVSREMGKPCIVGVTGLLNRLKTGDEIEMDGSTGEIKIIKNRIDA